jgi:hypothetical protein
MREKTMVFTDEDLEKLKAHIKVHFGDFNGECQLTAEGLASLVFRLEKAEKICAYVANLDIAIGDPNKEFEWCGRAIAKWLKACGK